MNVSTLAARVRAKEIILRWPVRPKKCASLECSRNRTFWPRSMDAMATVRFRGGEFCFPGCFSGELRRWLEQASSTVPAACLKSWRMPLGLLLLARGDLTQQQLQQALQAQKCAGTGKIGEWLRQLGLAGESEIAAALAQQWSCPLVRALPSRPADCAVPAHLLRAFRMVPVHFSASTRALHLAFAGSIAYKPLVCIEEMLDLKTEPCLTTERELAAALERIGDRQREGEKLFRNCRGVEEIVRIVSNYAGAFSAREIRGIRCGTLFWIRILAKERSSDLLFSQQDIQHDGAAPH